MLPTNILQTVPLFADVPNAALAVLTKLSQQQELAPGSIICQQGDVSNHLFVLLDGIVKATLETETGWRKTLALMSAPTTFGETVFFEARRRTATVETLTACSLVSIPATAIDTFVHEYPGEAVKLLRRLGDRTADVVRDTQDHLTRIALASSRQRVAHALVSLSEYGVPCADGLLLPPVTQADVACLAGVSRETSSRAIASFESEGLLQAARRRLTVLNAPALRNIAEV